MNQDCIIRFKNLTKRFEDNVANNQINLEIHKGQIHALLGENGSGKSTLMKILYGLYKSTEGEIYVRGEKVCYKSMNDAIARGIFMIHQHFMLIPQLTVAENVMAGAAGNKAVLDYKKMCRELQSISQEYGLMVNPDAFIWQLSVGEQQRVEIIKALYRGTEIMILDEPTSVLTPGEITDLLKVLRVMVNKGKTIIFITHKLEEVLEFADVCTILRAGNKIATVQVKDTNKVELSRMMVGRDVMFQLQKAPACPGDNVLELTGVSAKNEYGRTVLDDICLRVRHGEIMGVAGVDGNGQTELSEVITGMMKPTAGAVKLCGEDITLTDVATRIRRGMSYVPSERNGVGAIAQFNVDENVMLRDYNAPPFALRHILQMNEAAKLAQKLVCEYDVKVARTKAPVEHLSGGNLQKVILARELNRAPQFMVCMQPTRGLDIGAIEYIHKCLLRARDEGTGMLVISTDLEEVLALSDRVAVMFQGRIMGVLQNDKTLVFDQLAMMMAGVNPFEEGA